MNREEAIRVIKTGAIVTALVAIVTFCLVALATFTDASEAFAPWNDPMGFFDVILIFALAFGIYKRSRLAATIMFVYFLISKVVLTIQTGNLLGIPIGLLILFFIGKSVHGTFIYHKIKMAENPEPKRTSKWRYILGIPAGFIGAFVILLMIIGNLSMAGIIPDSMVKEGNQLPERARTKLVDNYILNEPCVVLYYYCDGMLSYLAGGTILTDRSLITYFEDEEGELNVYELKIDEISKVELISPGTALEDGWYKVVGFDEEQWIQFNLSAEGGKDKLLIEELRRRISAVERDAPKYI